MSVVAVIEESVILYKKPCVWESIKLCVVSKGFIRTCFFILQSVLICGLVVIMRKFERSDTIMLFALGLQILLLYKLEGLSRRAARYGDDDINLLRYPFERLTPRTDDDDIGGRVLLILDSNRYCLPELYVNQTVLFVFQIGRGDG
ncbi:hypothetical protein CASFOL_020392 [Castilleja foliolosa]|uniref:Uncharacterized protein n=1 Tax=Castilleja foliolosa TaxID=1961234 RepID=A0ABD3D4F4_9LAMI